MAIFFLGASFPLLVLAAAIFGYFRISAADAVKGTASGPPLIANVATLRTIAVWLVIWSVPLLALAGIFGRDHVLTQLSLFFSKLAVVTFGGAYAVLAYMGQDVVSHYGWLAQVR